jgi:hypothetical protein
MVGGDDRHFSFCQKLLGEDGSVRQGVVTVKYPGLFSPNFRVTSLCVFTQSLQKSQQNLDFRDWPVGTNSLCYNSCVDGGASLEYFGYHLVFLGLSLGLVDSKFIYNTLLGILFSSILSHT